jgi:endonuclease/exonuclease/phosphatase family metal-dependent hydrolase
MRLRLATWNLEGGGLDGADDTRMRRQMELLSSLSLDVALFQEAKGWAREGSRVAYDAEELLGMRGWLYPSAHHGCDLAIYIRPESGLRPAFERHEGGYPYWHGVARLAVRSPGFPGLLYLASTHLAPASEDQRYLEAQSFQLIVESGPLIAGGDWNALSASGPEPPGAASAAAGKLDRRAACRLEAAGLRDTGTLLGDPTPTVGHRGSLPYRCDRVYTSLPPGSVTGHQVIKVPPGLSDHMPVVTEHDLSIAAEAMR